MSLQDQLVALSAELKSRGIVDVKFHIDKESAPSINKIGEDMVLFIGAMNAGKSRMFGGIGDSHNPETVAWLEKVSENTKDIS